MKKKNMIAKPKSHSPLFLLTVLPPETHLTTARDYVQIRCPSEDSPRRLRFLGCPKCSSIYHHHERRNRKGEFLGRNPGNLKGTRHKSVEGKEKNTLGKEAFSKETCGNEAEL